MSAELIVHRVVLKATHRQYEWRFQDGVTVLVGPGSVGKTSLLNLIKWGLGGDALLSPAVRTYGVQVGIDVSIDGMRVGLLRGVRRARGVVAVVNKDGEVLRQLSADPGDDQRATVSDFLLNALGIPKVVLPRDRAAASGELTQVSFNDVFSYMYLDQDEIARSTIHHLEGYRDNKRMQTFEILYRIVDSDLARLRRDLAEHRAERDRLDAQILAVREFLTRSKQPSREEIDQRAAHLSGLIAVSERELATLQDQARAVSDSGNAVREEISALQAERDQAAARLADTRRESRRYVRVRSQLVQDLSRAVKAVVATPLFGSHEFTTCPRCLQTLDAERGSGSCRLCGQEDQEQTELASLTGEQDRVEAQLRETDELLGASERDQRELEENVERLGALIDATRQRLDDMSRQSVAPFVDRMNAVSGDLGERRSELQGLNTARRYLDEEDRLSARRDEVRRRISEIEAEIAGGEDESDIARQRITDLSDIFVEILEQLDLPWLRDAYVDRDSYLPIVNGERLEGLSSGSMKAQVNAAYFLTNFAYAVRGYDSLLPRFMMIDSPRVHHGASRTDRRAGERLYGWLMALQSALSSREPYLGDRRFQLIVADNDVPSKVRHLHRKAFSREEPLLHDVPGLDDDELLKGLEEKR